MDSGNIREVVMGFKRVIDNIPSQYDNFEDALDKFFEAFYLTMNELLPLKYFVLYEGECGYEIAIFDRAEDRDSWIDLICRAELEDCKNCHEIAFEKFIELSHDEWSNPNCYSGELEDMLIFSL